MRSELPRFRRPAQPRLDVFWARLEAELREEIVRHPPRRPRFGQRSLARWGRALLRPVLHGSSLALLLFIVLLAIRPQPVSLPVDAARAANEQPVWAQVVEIPDPSPQGGPFIIRQRAPRFVAFSIPVATPIEDRPLGSSPV